MDPVEIAVVGCGCTVATEPVAEISHRWNIPQVYMYIICSGMYELIITQIHQTGALEKSDLMHFFYLEQFPSMITGFIAMPSSH
jgi:hypothetical protein